MEEATLYRVNWSNNRKQWSNEWLYFEKLSSVRKSAKGVAAYGWYKYDNMKIEGLFVGAYGGLVWRPITVEDALKSSTK